MSGVRNLVSAAQAPRTVPPTRRYWWHDPHYLAESKRSRCAET